MLRQREYGATRSHQPLASHHQLPVTSLTMPRYCQFALLLLFIIDYDVHSAPINPTLKSSNTSIKREADTMIDDESIENDVIGRKIYVYTGTRVNTYEEVEDISCEITRKKINKKIVYHPIKGKIFLNRNPIISTETQPALGIRKYAIISPSPLKIISNKPVSKDKSIQENNNNGIVSQLYIDSGVNKLEKSQINDRLLKNVISGIESLKKRNKNGNENRNSIRKINDFSFDNFYRIPSILKVNILMPQNNSIQTQSENSYKQGMITDDDNNSWGKNNSSQHNNKWHKKSEAKNNTSNFMIHNTSVTDLNLYMRATTQHKAKVLVKSQLNFNGTQNMNNTEISGLNRNLILPTSDENLKYLENITNEGNNFRTNVYEFTETLNTSNESLNISVSTFKINDSVTTLNNFFLKNTTEIDQSEQTTTSIILKYSSNLENVGTGIISTEYDLAFNKTNVESKIVDDQSTSDPIIIYNTSRASVKEKNTDQQFVSPSLVTTEKDNYQIEITQVNKTITNSPDFYINLNLAASDEILLESSTLETYTSNEDYYTPDNYSTNYTVNQSTTKNQISKTTVNVEEETNYDNNVFIAPIISMNSRKSNGKEENSEQQNFSNTYGESDNIINRSNLKNRSDFQSTNFQPQMKASTSNKYDKIETTFIRDKSFMDWLNMSPQQTPEEMTSYSYENVKNQEISSSSIKNQLNNNEITKQTVNDGSFVYSYGPNIKMDRASSFYFINYHTTPIDHINHNQNHANTVEDNVNLINRNITSNYNNVPDMPVSDKFVTEYTTIVYTIEKSLTNTAISNNTTNNSEPSVENTSEEILSTTSVNDKIDNSNGQANIEDVTLRTTYTVPMDTFDHSNSSSKYNDKIDNSNGQANIEDVTLRTIYTVPMDTFDHSNSSSKYNDKTDNSNGQANIEDVTLSITYTASMDTIDHNNSGSKYNDKIINYNGQANIEDVTLRTTYTASMDTFDHSNSSSKYNSNIDNSDSQADIEDITSSRTYTTSMDTIDHNNSGSKYNDKIDNSNGHLQDVTLNKTYTAPSFDHSDSSSKYIDNIDNFNGQINSEEITSSRTYTASIDTFDPNKSSLKYYDNIDNFNGQANIEDNTLNNIYTRSMNSLDHNNSGSKYISEQTVNSETTTHFPTSHEQENKIETKSNDNLYSETTPSFNNFTFYLPTVDYLTKYLPLQIHPLILFKD